MKLFKWLTEPAEWEPLSKMCRIKLRGTR